MHDPVFGWGITFSLFCLSNANVVTLSNDIVSYNFNVDPQSVLFGQPSFANNVLWKASWTNNISTSELQTDASCSNGCSKSYISQLDQNSITFIWDNIILPDSDEGTPNVMVSVNMTIIDNCLSMIPTFQVKHNDNGNQLIGLWTWGIYTGFSYEEIIVFEPSGFGLIHQNNNEGNYQGDYPSGSSTMQFMAAYQPLSSTSLSSHRSKHMNNDNMINGLYFGIHDAAGSMKTLITTYSKANGVMFGFELYPPNAGVALDENSPYQPNFSIVLNVLNKNEDWYDASLNYRNFILSSSKWTNQGKVETPDWFHKVTTWVNSHWQQNDIFNVSGGDPLVLLPRMQAIVERFDLQPGQLAMHWYEWDLLGYDVNTNEYYGPCPDDIVNCGFDTNYPNYKGVRSGFNSSLQQIQDLGVTVFPYINGRIFDQSVDTWTSTGFTGAAKDLRSVSTLADNSSATVDNNGLDLYNESYGSEALFAVMCPYADDWQSAISDTVGMITEYGVDGVYIDQIGAAGPKPCFDATHGHPLGGGDFWVGGYRDMLDQTRQEAKGGVILTESNAEPYIGGVDVYLALTAFSEGDYSLTASNRIVPAFPAIYGGYYTACGAEFFQSDLTDGSDIFAAKLTAQFLSGAQMGWMSLGGRDNQVPAMGLYDLLMDSQYDDSVLFIKTLSNARAALGELFYQGRATRDLNFTTNSMKPQHRYVAGANRGLSIDKQRHLIGLEYDAIATQVWLDDSAATELTIIAVSIEKEQEQDVDIIITNMNVADYGYLTSSTTIGAYSIDLSESSSGVETLIGSFDPTQVNLQVSVSSRSVSAIRLKEL